MILRKLSPWVLVFSAFTHALAGDSFEGCIAMVGGAKYDLTPLGVEKTVTRTRETPPSTMLDELRFNICKSLEKKEGVPDADQCPPETQACLTKTNRKDGQDRIVAVVPLFSSSSVSTQTAKAAPLGLNLLFKGPTYPPSGDFQTPQFFNLTVLCTTTAEEPKLMSYEGGYANVEWSSPSGCVTKDDQKGDDKKGDEKPGDENREVPSSGGGLGWFFFLLLFSFAAYFALGAYHNWNNYGATGWDLVPHRDFWRDVPYLFRDLIAHLMASVGSSRSHHGYHSV